jgi:Arc/MetJ-type ribon-helix-helix transcriptional regulator
MARFMLSMPDEMLKKLDDAARREHRSRSELLREAARRHLAVEKQTSTDQDSKPHAKRKKARPISKTTPRERLLESGIGRTGCSGLERLVGAVEDNVDMHRLLKISRKLKGLSRQIIDSREDRW